MVILVKTDFWPKTEIWCKNWNLFFINNLLNKVCRNVLTQTLQNSNMKITCANNIVKNHQRKSNCTVPEALAFLRNFRKLTAKNTTKLRN